jgi:predicted membrane-bound spermidine synthase
MKTSIPRSWFFVLFTLSGFAGLIYESIWSHYLKLFLGHAAYAQTLVLAIFMGGMALGSWLCSRYSGRWRNLLLGYAVAEAVIGLCALLFHRVFVASTEFAYDSIMPGLGNPQAVNAFKWGFSTLLILPQSVLLGMTFPLMSAGLIRHYPDSTGGTIAMLYFTNSLGAAAGVLASGFLLIGLVGLPGTMLTAGMLNILLALLVWALAKNMVLPSPAATRVEPARRAPTGHALMLSVAFLTGAASFIYEIGWIRMLTMVLGSSTHAFELMLSAFILGLAFGGLWIKRRIDRTGEPERLLGIVQVVMGLCALATLLVYGGTFEIMRWLLGVLARTDSGYAAFNVGSHLIALLVMFPAAFCAGMTLPLITHALMRRGGGEPAIGAVYAANTVGAITGVFFAVHVGMPVLGLKGLISIGAGIDIALGLILLWRVGAGGRLAYAAAVLGAGAAAVTLLFVQLDPYKMASGVYRHGALLTPEKSQIEFHHDGKTATVNLLRLPGDRVSILTNGKSDAAINLNPNGPIATDETTMVLTAALPIALHPGARTAANIGFGSGLTSHVLLAADTIREVDTIEIESAMVEAARGFSPRNDNVYLDPRSRIHIEDAKTFFSTHSKRYDIIASEPSNPWVSGVASLFTEEFYRHIKRHLNEGGLFVQWMQLYEINTPLVATVIKALGRHFSDYVIFSSYDRDIIIIARNGAALPPLSDTIFAQPRLARELERIRIRNLADLELHRIGNKRGIHPFFESYDVPPNSNYFPVLDLNAAKARFMGALASEVVNLSLTPIPVAEMLGGLRPRGAINTEPRPWLRRAEYTREALAGRTYLLEGRAEHLRQVPSLLRSDFEIVRLLALECTHPRHTLSMEPLFAVAGALVPYLTHDELGPVWRRFRDAPCYSRLDEAQRGWIELFAAIGARDPAGMTRHAETLLGRETVARKDYLLSAAIVGRLVRGEREAAIALWREFAPGMASDAHNVMPNLLRGHLFSGSPAAPGGTPRGTEK